MKNLVRDAPFGQLVRYLTDNRILKYPEEEPGFQCPESYITRKGLSRHSSRGAPRSTQQRPASTELDNTEKQEESPGTSVVENSNAYEEVTEDAVGDLEKVSSAAPSDVSRHNNHLRPVSSHITRTKSLPYTQERLRQEEEAAIERSESRPIAPVKTADGTILVDWYSTDDPENPQVRLIH